MCVACALQCSTHRADARHFLRSAASLRRAKHHPDLIMCRKLPGIAIGRLCEKCAWRAPGCMLCAVAEARARTHAPAGDGKCVICDSYVRPATLVRVCDECNYGSYAGRCVICGGVGISDAYYCKECTLQEKDVRGFVCLCAAKARPKPSRLATPPTHAQRDGCPKIVNLGSAKTDLFYERKKCASRSASARVCTQALTPPRASLARSRLQKEIAPTLEWAHSPPGSEV